MLRGTRGGREHERRAGSTTRGCRPRPEPTGYGAHDGNVPVAAARRFADRLPGVDPAVRDDADNLETLLDCRGAALDTVADWSGAERRTASVS